MIKMRKKQDCKMSEWTEYKRQEMFKDEASYRATIVSRLSSEGIESDVWL